MKRIKMKSLRMLLTLFIAVFMLSAFVLALNVKGEKPLAKAADNDEWDGSVATSFAGGTGTEDDPYLISTGAELSYLADVINNNKADDNNGGYYNSSAKYYALDNDIYLNDTENWQDWGTNVEPKNSWTPIGRYTPANAKFAATFDGKGFAVFGIYINSASSYIGLFGCIEGGNILNIGVKESYIRGGLYTGGVAGNSLGIIKGCYNSGVVIGLTNCGGIAGGANNIEDCYNAGAVACTGNSINYLGGIAGVVSGNIVNCHNTGKVSGSSYTALVYVGGVVGHLHGGKLTNCSNEGEVSGSGDYTGGIVGRINHNAGMKDNSITGCRNTGKVSGNQYTGGIAGGASGSSLWESSITNCSNTGEITGKSYTGGVIGNAGNYSSAVNCYNTGNVSGNGSYIGGVAGIINNLSSMINCYNTGNITNASSYTTIGGVAGEVYDNGSVINCYFLKTGATNSSRNAIGDGSGTTAEFNASGEITVNEIGGVIIGDYLLNALNMWVKDNNASRVYYYWEDEVFPIFTEISPFPQYIVTFKSNGGSAVASQEADEGGKTAKPVDPARTGYTFGGWYRDEDCETTWDFDTDIVTENITLYAKWTINTYTVTFSSNGNTYSTVNADYGSKITKPATNPLRMGYTFGGWYKEENCTTIWNFDADTIGASNITLYAKWTINAYTVTFESNGSTYTTLSADYSSKITKPITDPARTGYTFGGWYKEENCTTAWDFNTDTVTDDITLYANWTINTYTVTFSSNGNTYSTVNADYGGKITKPITDPARTGYTFGGWYKDENCTTIWNFDTDTIGASNIILYAKWTADAGGDEPSGLSPGAIASIVIGSIVVAGLGGFSVFWFVIKKKKFTDLFSKNK